MAEVEVRDGDWARPKFIPRAPEGATPKPTNQRLVQPHQRSSPKIANFRRPEFKFFYG